MSKPNLKVNVKENYMNNSTELPQCLNGYYSNMDVIVESDGMEENLSNFGTPKGSYWGNKSYENLNQNHIRKGKF